MDSKGPKKLQQKKKAMFKHIFYIAPILVIHLITFLIVTCIMEYPNAKIINHRAPGVGHVVITLALKDHLMRKNWAG